MSKKFELTRHNRAGLFLEDKDDGCDVMVTLDNETAILLSIKDDGTIVMASDVNYVFEDCEHKPPFQYEDDGSVVVKKEI